MHIFWAFSALLLGCWQVTAYTASEILTDPSEVRNQTSAVLRCNLNSSTIAIKGSYWMRNGKVIENSKTTDSTLYTVLHLDRITLTCGGKYECVFLTDKELKQTIEVKTLPHVFAYNHYEHGYINEDALLTCLSRGYPLPTNWMWFKQEDNPQTAPQSIINGSSNKYEIKSTSNKTTLTIKDLSIQNDNGDYICSGTNEIGRNSDTIHLRVHDPLTAVWPFLGILAEIIILVTIILVYEKRRKPNRVNDDDDSGSAPLKSNCTAKH
ncbi:Basigin 5A11 antigen Blood-brain barrier HT7 antigen Neurothelin Precursor [Channa argus]|uniref:Basigin 5A11 antigen Blood-brain barrier HT7 antigen Neurothelin n=1 Tax=Channa argus TaxID=215402 RepID=A0A6G1R2B4_CHAAH|nr:Basigin 5A11 antigen Blood-brain barrier HT7 antigen Neurothelin Precursor [Channa argus]KAK2922192.1 hypothetical protein Q8A73_001677 [Channa argus]